jgi:predicted nuclease of predicted toxin-antitoxin system
VRFLIDAQLPPSLAAALCDAGCDAVHIGEIGLLAATDRQIWDEAKSRSAVLVTEDRDFTISAQRATTVPWCCGFASATPTIEP